MSKVLILPQFDASVLSAGVEMTMSVRRVSAQHVRAFTAACASRFPIVSTLRVHDAESFEREVGVRLPSRSDSRPHIQPGDVAFVVGRDHDGSVLLTELSMGHAQ